MIGGLLDYLLERHPGSTLLGFKNGPGGIISKSYMEITEDLMVGCRFFNHLNTGTSCAC